MTPASPEDLPQRLRRQVLRHAQAYREQLLQRLLVVPASDWDMIQSPARH